MNRRVLAGAVLAALAAAGLYAAAGPMTPGGFSRQMGAHLLLSYVAAPLLVLAWERRPTRNGRADPLTAFVTLNAVTFGLHLPAVHTALMAPWGRALQGALFLAAGVRFWTVVARGGLGSVALLLGQMAACALLGAAVTFSRDVYAMTGPTDTALGGVLMWVAGGVVLMSAALAQLVSLLTAHPTGVEA